MMEATEIVLPAVGEPESLQIRRRELPDLRAGQALVRVEASGVSFAEQQMRRGKYYDQPPFPFVPGYDLVGVVEKLGPPAGDGEGASAVRTGARVASLTKTGGWADRVVLETADLVPVPDGVDAAEAETVVVNGVTAWRMLHRTARVPAGATVVVLGAAGGVGTTLVQLARQAGIHVIGTASPRAHDRLRELGAEPVDYRDDVPARVRELAPDGVAAVFDHVGGPGIHDSWRMLAPGGTLVSYGSASTKDEPGKGSLPVLKLVARLMLWNVLPNSRHAYFYNLWAGRSRHLGRYRAELRDDLGQVFRLLADGAITAQVARVFPLDQAGAALRYAESGGITGKVVLRPGHAPGADPDAEARTAPATTTATGSAVTTATATTTAPEESPMNTVPASVDRTAPVLSHHETDIRASLEEVWRLHADVANWPGWNTDITEARPADAERPFTPGASFTWTSFGFTVTSTVYEVTDEARVLWGGTADGITGIHEWRFTRTPDGVHVVTDESFAGAPVEADPGGMREALDASLVAWLAHLKKAAEGA